MTAVSENGGSLEVLVRITIGCKGGEILGDIVLAIYRMSPRTL